MTQSRVAARMRADRVPLSGGRFYSKPEILRLRAEFDACDDDGSGEVSVKELAGFLHRQRRQKEREREEAAAKMARDEEALAMAGPGAGAGRGRRRVSVSGGGSSGLDMMAGPSRSGGRSEAEKLAAGDAWASVLLAYIDKDGSGEVGFSEFLMLHYPDSSKKEREGIAAWVEQVRAEGLGGVASFQSQSRSFSISSQVRNVPFRTPRPHPEIPISNFPVPPFSSPLSSPPPPHRHLRSWPSGGSATPPASPPTP